MNFTSNLNTILEPDRWYHICVQKTKRSVIVIIDGAEQDHLVLDREILTPLNGSLIFGQDQDEVGGGFSAPQSFSGMLAGFEMWVEILNSTQINRLAKCKLIASESIFRFTHGDWIENGHINTTYVNPCKKTNNNALFLIPVSMTYDEGIKFCKLFNMELTYPYSEEEFAFATKMIEKLPPICSTIYSVNERAVFISLKFDNKSQSFVNPSTGCSPDYVPEYKGTWSSDWRQNVLLHSSFGKWTYNYDQKKNCLMCGRFFNTKRFELHGFVSSCRKTRMYYYARYTTEHFLYFKGRFGDVLYYHEQKWVLRHWPTLNVLATLTGEPFPMGRKKWKIYFWQNECMFLHELYKIRVSNYSRTKTLVFSKCKEEDFTCDDGECVPMSARCTQSIQCKDGSDEENCVVLSVKKNFSKYLPPPQSPFEMKISSTLHKVSLNFVSKSKLDSDD